MIPSVIINYYNQLDLAPGIRDGSFRLPPLTTMWYTMWYVHSPSVVTFGDHLRFACLCRANPR